jgi:hypothetical protein
VSLDVAVPPQFPLKIPLSHHGWPERKRKPVKVKERGLHRLCRSQSLRPEVPSGVRSRGLIGLKPRTELSRRCRSLGGSSDSLLFPPLPHCRIPTIYDLHLSMSLSSQDLQRHLYASFIHSRTPDVAIRVKGASWHAIYRLHRVVLIQAASVLAPTHKANANFFLY